MSMVDPGISAPGDSLSPLGELVVGWVAEMVGASDLRHWAAIERRSRDGQTEKWWALGIEAGPYGSARGMRAVVVATEPAPPDQQT